MRLHDPADKDEAEIKHEDNVREEDCSDEDFFPKLCPRDFESGELVKICKLALAHYQAKNPGESYKFERWHGGNYYVNIANRYNLEFCAKKADDNSIQNFKAFALYHDRRDEPEEFQVIICFKLKDGQPELPLDYSIEMYLEPAEDRPNLLHESLEKKEFAKILKFCKSALSNYNENSAEFYELVEIQEARRYVHRGYEYVLVFTAKKKDEIITSTFKTYCRHLATAIEIWSCTTY